MTQTTSQAGGAVAGVEGSRSSGLSTSAAPKYRECGDCKGSGEIVLYGRVEDGPMDCETTPCFECRGSGRVLLISVESEAAL